MARKKLPAALKNHIMYESGFVCAICQEPGCQIHHIDGDHSNDVEENLICICNKHHGEAHTKRELSQNLDPKSLRHAKKMWNEAMRSKRDATASVSGQIAKPGNENFASLGITWGYINHKRVNQMVKIASLAPQDKELLDFCVSRGIVDDYGIPIEPENPTRSDSYLRNSIYDTYSHSDGQRLHKFYVALVDSLSRTRPLIHLEREWWTKARVREMLEPGSLFFVQTSFYFKPVDKTAENEQRRVHTKRKKVSIEFFVDTQDMFGTTSMTVSFQGHQACGAFLHLKSMAEADTGELILSCTPIGLGVGFGKQ